MKPESTIISAIVPIQMPPIDTAEIMLMALCDFLEIRYRLAMKRDKFKMLQITDQYKTANTHEFL